MNNLYAVYDTTAETIVSSIIQARIHQAATRDFFAALEDKNGLGRYPAEYELRFIGTVDHQGNITPANETIASGTHWLLMKAETANG